MLVKEPGISHAGSGLPVVSTVRCLDRISLTLFDLHFLLVG